MEITTSTSGSPPPLWVGYFLLVAVPLIFLVWGWAAFTFNVWVLRVALTVEGVQFDNKTKKVDRRWLHA
jgi:cytochrome b